MKRLHAVVSVSTVVIVLALTTSASAGESFRHSGSIVSIAEDGATFVLAEVGPWQVGDGDPVITYRTITLVPETEYTVVARAESAPSGFPGDFAETEVPDGVYVNDYVTVDCRHEGRRMVALKITVIELPEAEPGEGAAGGGR